MNYMTENTNLIHIYALYLSIVFVVDNYWDYDIPLRNPLLRFHHSYNAHEYLSHLCPRLCSISHVRGLLPFHMISSPVYESYTFPLGAFAFSHTYGITCTIGIRTDVVVLLTQRVHGSEKACSWVILTGDVIAPRLRNFVEQEIVPRLRNFVEQEIIEVQTVGVLELLTSELIWLKSRFCVHVTKETTIGIVMRHLLYLTILADHDAIIAEMVTAIVVEMGCVGDICMCPYRQNQSTGTYCHPYEIERFPIHLFYFISF